MYGGAAHALLRTKTVRRCSGGLLAQVPQVPGRIWTLRCDAASSRAWRAWSSSWPGCWRRRPHGRRTPAGRGAGIRTVRATSRPAIGSAARASCCAVW